MTADAAPRPAEASVAGDRSRHAEGPADLPTPQEMAALTGLDWMRGVLEGRLAPAPIARTLGFWMTEAEEGRVTFRGRPSFEVCNPMGAVHGGWYGALLDSCMACAGQTRLAAGKGYTTLEYKVNLVRALGATSGEVLAIGEAVHSGRRTFTAEGRIVGADDGKLYATGTTTCLVLDL